MTKTRKLYKKIIGRKRLEKAAKNIDRAFNLIIQLEPMLANKRNHRMLILFRLRCGKPAYTRMAGLDGLNRIGADMLEFWSLKTRKNFTKAPFYNAVLFAEKMTQEIFGLEVK